MTEPNFPPVISYEDILQTDDLRHGYLKCRLIHMQDRSFVLPDILMVSGQKRSFYSPQFFHPNLIGWFGGDGSADFCRVYVEVLGKVDLEIVFFKNKVVKRCADGSFIYKCRFKLVGSKVLPPSQGEWRKRRDQFELALYHHTTQVGANGIRNSREIWSSPWNIQGTQKLKNIAYGYFTCIPEIKYAWELWEVAMAENGQALFLKTNAPNDAQFAVTLDVYKRTPVDIEVPLRFWVDVETISPSHLWLHVPTNAPTFYEVVLPKVFRVGVAPEQSIPIEGNLLKLKPNDCKNFEYVIVGDADTNAGLIAPYHEEETFQLGKVDQIPDGVEIIDRWQKKKNTYVYEDRYVELAILNRDNA